VVNEPWCTSDLVDAVLCCATTVLIKKVCMDDGWGGGVWCGVGTLAWALVGDMMADRRWL